MTFRLADAELPRVEPTPQLVVSAWEGFEGEHGKRAYVYLPLWTRHLDTDFLARWTVIGVL